MIGRKVRSLGHNSACWHGVRWFLDCIPYPPLLRYYCSDGCSGRQLNSVLLALLLGSLARTIQPDVTFLHVLPSQAAADEMRRAKRDLRHLAADMMRRRADIEVVRSDDALMAVIERAQQFVLVILGVQRLGRRTKLFGSFARQIAQRVACPLVLMSRRG